MAQLKFGALPPLELAGLEKLEMIDTARSGEGVESVAAFGMYVFGMKPAAHHRRWLEAKLEHKRVVIVAPPESAKTTWSIILMAWSIGRAPHKTFMFVSVGEKLAHAMAETVANCIENNPRWKDVFPNVAPSKERGWSREGYEVVDTAVPPDRWQKLIATKKDPTLLSGGVGSANINGRRVSGRLECDDIHDDKSKASDVICQDTVDFLRDTVLSRVTEEAFFGMEQTRWNPSDSVAYISGLKNPDGSDMYRVFEHPALDRNGESYWPEMWPPERLERKRIEVGPEAWALQYMGDAEAARQHILRLQSLRTLDRSLIKPEHDRYFGIDYAQRIQDLVGTTTKDPDYFALAVWAHTGEFLVLVDGLRERLSIGDAEEVFFQWADHWRPVRCAVEVNGPGANYYASLLRRMNTRGGPRHVVVPVTTTQNKLVRIREMAPFFDSGQLRVSDEDNYFLRTFRNEWAGFGTKSAHDDTLDAAYLGWRTASGLMPYETNEKKRERELARDRQRNPFELIEAAYR